MAAECRTCGEPVKHSPDCAVLAHKRMVKTVTERVKVFIPKPVESMYSAPGQYIGAEKEWGVFVRELALMLVESHPDYDWNSTHTPNWVEDLEESYLTAMGYFE